MPSRSYAAVNRLRWSGRRFRAAVERAIRRGALPLPGDPVWFHTFPQGQCDHTARLLAAWLISEGWDDVRTVAGGEGTDRAHRWCEVGGVIVDVTADQFPEVSEPVVVCRREESPYAFHRAGRTDAHPATEIEDLAHHVPDYARAFDAIVGELGAA